VKAFSRAAFKRPSIDRSVSLVYNLHADKASRRIGEAVAQALVWEEQACLLMLCELVISVYSKKPIIDIKLGNCALGYQNLTTT
jgi:hypothetical protein